LKNKIIDKYFSKITGEGFLSLKLAILLFVLEVISMTLFYIFHEGFTLIESIYMTVILISTVGFSEVHPLTPEGQLFTSVFILINIGIFAYTLSAFTFFVIQGELFKKMFIDRINRKIENLENHVIICGYGRYGREIVANFKENNLPFVIIEHDEDKINKMNDDPDLLFIMGDSTDDDILIQAGIMKARALISALQDDTENLYTMLTVRELNPTINLISRAQHKRAHHKLMLAGATHVIMPEQIGGFYMATLVNKPDAAEFFNFITREYDSDMGYETIRYEDLPEHCNGKSIADLKLRNETGVNIIGFKSIEDKYTVNPGPDTMLIPGASFIVLGNKEQLSKLKKYLKK